MYVCMYVYTQFTQKTICWIFWSDQPLDLGYTNGQQLLTIRRAMFQLTRCIAQMAETSQLWPLRPGVHQWAANVVREFWERACAQ